MRTLTLLLITGLLALAGCGGDDETPAPSAQQGSDPAMEKDAGSEAMEKKDAGDEAMEKKDAGDEARQKKDAGDAMAKGSTKIVLSESDFGDMLFDSKNQAIYIFENDPEDESACYGECAEAWPPVFTDGDPAAAEGIDAELLGTTKRRDGKLQVTYAGQPLYYYAHEKPGEVKCHNVNLNGGFWWVVGADGKRLA